MATAAAVVVQPANLHPCQASQLWEVLGPLGAEVQQFQCWPAGHTHRILVVALAAASTA